MKIKVFNPQTNAFQEQVIAPKINNINRWLIGRHYQCDLILDSPEISRVHALIDYHNNQYHFLDLNSTDGSRINNQEAEINYSYILQPDDILRIGDFVLMLEDWEMENYPKSATTINQNQPGKIMGNFSARCVQVIEETPDVKTFRLAASNPREFTYQPGQFVTLDLDIEGEQVKRSYSISSSPSRPHMLEITVKRVPAPADIPHAPPGLVSNWLHDNIKVGSELKLAGAYGDFTCTDKLDNKLLFISAGSGITPMMSMTRWLHDTHVDTDVVFVHSAKTTEDLIFHKELQWMASRYPNFKLAINLTRPKDNESWLGYTGRLNEVMLPGMAPDFRERLVYVCGPDPFREGVKGLLESLNFPMENYHEESFGVSKPRKKSKSNVVNFSSAKSLDNSTKQPTKLASQDFCDNKTDDNIIVFTKSGQEVSCDGEETILEVAKGKGINLPHACGQGVCGQCKLRKLEGEVCYEQEPSCEEGFVLTCIAQPLGRVAIEG